MTKETTFVKKTKKNKKKTELGLTRPKEVASFLFTGSLHWTVGPPPCPPKKILSKVNHTRAGETPGIITHVIYVIPRWVRTTVHSKHTLCVLQLTIELQHTLISFSCFNSTQRAKRFCFNFRNFKLMDKCILPVACI